MTPHKPDLVLLPPSTASHFQLSGSWHPALGHRADRSNRTVLRLLGPVQPPLSPRPPSTYPRQRPWQLQRNSSDQARRTVKSGRFSPGTLVTQTYRFWRQMDALLWSQV